MSRATLGQQPPPQVTDVVFVYGRPDRKSTRLLVRTLFRWWMLPTKLNDATKEAITLAVGEAGCSIVAIASA